MKQSVAYLLLVFFISIKLTGAHAYFHEEDHGHSDDCQVCEYAITTNLTPVLAPDTPHFVFENDAIISDHFIQTKYPNGVVKTLLTSQLVSRPPPIFS